MDPATSPQGPGGPHLDCLELRENNEDGGNTETWSALIGWERDHGEGDTWRSSQEGEISQFFFILVAEYMYLILENKHMYNHIR
jgi:hypothetical protein